MKQVWFVLTIALGLAAPADARELQPKVPSLAVRIMSAGGGLGSGFYVETDRGTYLITAKHVLFDTLTGQPLVDSITLISYPENPTDTVPLVIRASLGTSLSAGNVKYHDVKDIAASRLRTIDSAGGRATPGVEIDWRARVPSVTTISEHAMFDSVVVGREAYVIGYPGSLLSEQIDFRMPLVRSGVIAGKNHTNKTFFTDCAVFYGSSGGPVVQLRRLGSKGQRYIHETVGVVIQIVGDFVVYNDSVFPGNSGYSVVVPMDFVSELISQWEKDEK